MSAEKREQAGLLAAWHAAAIIARLPFTGTVLDPTEINPFKSKPTPKPKAMRELEQWQAKRMWSAMYGSKKKKPVE